MKGYKAFDKNLRCKDMQYEVGKEYEFNGKPIPCKQGFHFCKSIAETYNFYPMEDDTRICEVEAIGDIATDDDIKYCTNKIRILSEITERYIRHGNTTANGDGFCNSGNGNLGNKNSGDWNSGNHNSGDYNIGSSNSGYRNFGSHNSGDFNSGDFNSGDFNSGDHNSGDFNSGDWNSGNHNLGIFNTEKKPTIKMFDLETNWTYKDWYKSEARYILMNCPKTHTNYVPETDMTDEEKEKYPEYKIIGGFIKIFMVSEEDRQKWWDEELSDDSRRKVMSLPNFDKEKFYQCTRIRIK